MSTIDRTVTLANWMEAPFNRIAFQRVREVIPTALIRNRTGRTRTLAERPLALDSVPVTLADGSRSSWGEQLASSYCDAVCVVHHGAIVFERYFNGMTPDTPHLLMSVSKSVCAAALGIAIGEGRLAAADLVCDVAPEFAGTSLDGATVQHVIDMTAGTEFVEDYALYEDPDGDAPLIEFERQSGYRPLGARQPIGTLGHFRTYPTAFAHGSRFDYRSPLTNIAARLVEVANGERFPDAVSRVLWGPLGQEFDADIMLDPLGHPVAEGGISCAVRDLARFGLAYLDGGHVEGSPLIPADWVIDTQHATDDSVALFATSERAELGWSHYRNAFWVLERDQVFSGLGIFGQYCYVDRPSNTVIARFSTYPQALPEDLSAETLGAFAAVCASLMG
jgi:CubicO group peptidase (beta-lactamase class C family)